MRHATISRLFAIVLALFAVASPKAREIAITFDDAPRQDSAIMRAEERARMLVDALAAAGVDEAAFFALPRELSAEGEAQLRRYAEAGHVIANHSATHPDLARVGAQEFLADVQRADEQLRDLPGFRRWFRFPFLREGDTEQKRDAVRVGLEDLAYRHGYVTVDNYDWYIDRLANLAVDRGESVNFEALRELYVENLVQAAEFYDELAERYLGRSPRHVLLLHENDMAALYVKDLVARLEEKGWTIVSATDAYQDPIAERLPDTLFLGQGRVAALAHVAGAPPHELVSPQEEQALIDEQFRTRVLTQRQ